MTRIHRIVRPLAAITVLAVVGSFAVAGGGGLQLKWTLVGPALNGVVPSGKAELDESSLPGQLKVEVQNVNLPDGTELEITIAFTRVGTLNLMGGQAKLETTVPFEVRADPVDILFDGETIMVGMPQF